MQIERSDLNRSGVAPEILDVLNADFHLPLINRDLKLRHPFGIYTVSILHVLNSFEAMLDEYERLFIDKATKKIGELPREWWQSTRDPLLLTYQRDLLYSLMEHLDDCFNILKCFVPKTTVSNTRNKKEYQKKVPAIKKAMRKVFPYYKHVSSAVNHNKHNQGRLRICIIEFEDYVIPGYFVESCDINLDPADGTVAEWEAIGPLAEIHGKYRDTVFSFARDIRFHFVNVYIVSRYVAEAVISLVGNQYTSRNRDTRNIESKIFDIAQRIERLPLYFFPDEQKKDVPTVKTSGILGTRYIDVAYPDPHIVLLSPPLGNTYPVFIPYPSDGVSLTYKLPYFTGPEPPKMVLRKPFL